MHSSDINEHEHFELVYLFAWPDPILALTLWWGCVQGGENQGSMLAYTDIIHEAKECKNDILNESGMKNLQAMKIIFWKPASENHLKTFFFLLLLACDWVCLACLVYSIHRHHYSTSPPLSVTESNKHTRKQENGSSRNYQGKNTASKQRNNIFSQRFQFERREERRRKRGKKLPLLLNHTQKRSHLSSKSMLCSDVDNEAMLIFFCRRTSMYVMYIVLLL